MEFRILGPLEVRADGVTLALGGRKQRALLAILLLHADEVVSRDVLIDGLWGEQPPASAGHTIEAYVHRLRKILRTGGTADPVLVTRAPGYLLRVGPGELDLHRFELLVGEGRDALAAGAPDRAADLLGEALGLWRGTALADIDCEPFARLELDRLAELRHAALEERVEADLACGRHRELVAELEVLVARFPLRERPREQLMLALHRCGRQADALALYRETHSYLIAELGVEPGPALRAMQEAILRQDPALGAGPVRRERLSGSVGAGRGWRRAGAVLALAGIAAITLALSGSLRASEDAGPAVRGNAVAAVDAVTGRVSSVVRLQSAPSAVAAGFGSLWAAEYRTNSIARVDPHGHVVQTIVVGSGPSGVATGAGAVWVANSLDGTVSRIDPRTQTVVQTIDVAGAPAAIAVTSGAVWVAANDVSRLDARTGRVVARIAVAGHATALAVGAGSVWAGGSDGRTVARIDPHASAVTATIAVGGSPGALAFGAGGLWAANALDGTISRVDPASNRVATTIEVGASPIAIAAAGATIWVADDHRASLIALNPQRPAARRVIALAAHPGALATTAGRLWAAVRDTGASHRGGTLVLDNPASRFDSIDPAIQYNVLPAQLLGMTNDGLVSFNHVGGRAGTQLVADLATSLPSPADHRRSYTFHLRSGIRYSDGRLLRAGDLRRGIERLFRLNSPGAIHYDAIVGAARCARDPAHCRLARGIVTDDRRATVTFKLTAPDPDFLYRLALPFADAVPVGTPDHDVGLHPVPATGPYRIAGYRPGHSLRLVRNPRFRQWSSAAQPDGYPDQIIWRLGIPQHAGIAQVLAGAADWVLSIGQALPAPHLRDLQRRYPSQLHVNPLMQTDYMVLNVNVAPFNDVRVRRAVNYALDRRALSRLYGTGGAQPTCQVLPPQMPGYARYCPYTLHPRRDGAWLAPDLATARRLISASGTRGMKVVVWDTPEAGTFLEEGRATVDLLRRLGYRASLRLVPDATFARSGGNSSLHVPVVSGGWSADYPSPSSFIKLKLSCAAFKPATDNTDNVGGFCDHAIDRQVAQAQRLQTAAPQRAAALWQRIERQLVDRAAWLPMVTPRTTDLVSRRAGNYQFHPLWGLLVDQLWVR
jgi:peptide/nickel transport system substrate-binding protein